MVDSGHISSRPRPRLSFQRVLGLLVRHPAAGLGMIGILTLVFGYHLPGLTFRSSIYDLVVEDLPETERYDLFKSVFGSEEIIRVVIRAEDVFDAAAFEAVSRLSDTAARITGVRRVISLPEVKKAVDVSGRMDLTRFQALIAPVALFQKNLLSADHRATVLTLLLENEADRQATIDGVRRMLAGVPATMSAYQIGMPLVAEALAAFTERDFLRLPPLTLALMLAALLVLYRNPAAAALPIACVALTLVWTFGLMAWIGTPLSMLTMIVPVFLIGVGSAYCLHVLSEYFACARNASSPRQAVVEAFGAVTLPTLLAVATTVAGLASLFINRIVSIHEFAFFACAGMLGLLVILMVFLPSALALYPLREKPGRLNRLDRWMDMALDAVVGLSLRHRRAVLGAVGALCLACCLGLAFIRVETNPVDQFRADAPISRHFHDVYRDLSGSFPVNVVMDGRMEDFFEKPGNVARLPALQRFLESLPGVDKTLSLADYMMLVNYVLNRFDPAAYALPEEDYEVRMVLNNFKNLLGEEMLSGFVSPDFSKTTVLLLTHLSNSVEFLRLRERILDHARGAQPEGIGWEVTGFGIVIAASSHLLTLGQVKSFALTIVFIFALMSVLFLSVKVGLIATLPNILPILVVFGLMGWFGISLSMVTGLVASIAVGLAVDDTVHYLVRYNREFKRDLNKDRAIRDTIHSVGRPILLTTLIISLGFSILVFSQFKPTATFGVLMVMTMSAALVGDLILLPALMLHVELVSAWDLLRRMPALEAMSATAAHELRQPLNAIKMGSDFLDVILQKGETPAPEVLAHVSAEIGLQVDRATAIVDRMSRYAPQPDSEPGEADANRAVRDAMELVAHRLALENISVRLDLAENLPALRAHGHRLGQVLLNLLANAAEAIQAREKAEGARRGGTILVRTGIDGDRVAITVEDDGIGIPDHHLNRIMEPFFTTKEASPGRGLGLSVCSQIVKGYGGGIRARRGSRAGAVIEVTLPRAHPQR